MGAIKLIERNIKRRTGFVAKKAGMSQLFMEDGRVISVTLLEVPVQTVVGIKTQKNHGYNAIQLAYEDISLNKINKPQRSLYANLNISPKRNIKEFIVSEDALLEVGQTLHISHFINGQKVDVRGVSIGKGFAGVMKRHNFRGLEASHGVSITHRSHGSTGQRQDPGKVFKNKKMAGHLGNVSVCIQNLSVVSIDIENSLIIVKGAVPGKKGSYVVITDAVKGNINPRASYPASVVSNEDN